MAALKISLMFGEAELSVTTKASFSQALTLINLLNLVKSCYLLAAKAIQREGSPTIRK
jgi:hypothetical protein